MDAQEIRLKCLDMALAYSVRLGGKTAVETAKELEAYVVGEKKPKAEPTEETAGHPRKRSGKTPQRAADAGDTAQRRSG